MHNTTEDDWQGRLADYTFGVMEAGEAQEFERSLLECREHVELATSYQEIASLLALAVPPEEPPAGHKSRLMSRITSTPQSPGQAPPSLLATTSLSTRSLAEYEVTPRPMPTTEPEPVGVARSQVTGSNVTNVTDMAEYRERRKGTPAVPLLMAIAAALILAVGLWGWFAQSDKGRLERELSVAQVEKARLEQELVAQQAQVNIPPGAVSFPIQAQEAGSTSAGIALLNPETNRATVLFNGLEPLPSDRVYELWLLPESTAPEAKPVAAGVFTPGSDGRAQHSVDAPSSLRDYAGLAVTIEQGPSGSDAPTQNPILVGAYGLP